MHLKIHRESPLGRLQILRGGRAGGLAGRRLRQQSLDLRSAVGLVLRLHPFGVEVTAGSFFQGAQPALGRAFQERIEEGSGDRLHGATVRFFRPSG